MYTPQFNARTIKLQKLLGLTIALSVLVRGTATTNIHHNDDSGATTGGGLLRGNRNHSGKSKPKQRNRELSNNSVWETGTTDGMVVGSFWFTPPVDVHTGIILHYCLRTNSENLCLAFDVSKVSSATVLDGDNDLKCEEDTTNDGSIVCDYRTTPPPDTSTSNILHDCFRVGSENICLTVEISRVSYADVPFPSPTPAPVTSTRPPTPAPVVASTLPPTPSPVASTLPPMAPISIPGIPNTISIPPAVLAPPETAEEFVSPFHNSNPDCPSRTEVPVTGDQCSYSGKYYSCMYQTSATTPPLQCRCNHDGIFYCRAVEWTI